MPYSNNIIYQIKKGESIYDIKDAVAAAAIDVLNGNASTEGSVAKAVADAQTALKGTKSEGDTTAETIRGAKDYADAKAADAQAAAEATAASDATSKANAAQAAAEATAASDATSKVNTAKTELKGTSSDASSAETIAGAKKYADEKAAAAQQAAIDKVNELAGTDWTKDAGTVKNIIDELTAEGNTATEAMITVADKLRGDFSYGATGSQTTDVKSYIDGKVADAQGNATGAIAALDATPSQVAGADGLALSLTQVDGVVTTISGSIAANTYDANGAAAAVLGVSGDAASANTVFGAKAYTDSKASSIANGILTLCL